MLAKKIKYTNYNGEERERTFYFNLSKAEIIEMELKQNGGYQAFIDRIVETRDYKELIGLFKELIHNAYGVRSDDGELFIKNEQVYNEFAQSEAYSELYMELLENTQSAIEFVNGIFPKKLMDEVQKDPEYQKKMDEIKAMAQPKPTPVQ